MGFKALNQDGEAIYSFNFNQEQWIDLKSNHNKQLKMNCCKAVAIPKTSVNGTPFFAHHTQGNCNHKPESAEHMFCKYLCVMAFKYAGWDVVTEKPLKTPCGKDFYADVYATKGNHKLSIEVQWSRQSDDDFIERTKKYIDSELPVFWLYRFDSRLTSCNTMPIFKLRKNADQSFTTSWDNNCLSVSDFIKNLTSGKIGTLHKMIDIHLAMLREYFYCQGCSDNIYFDRFVFVSNNSVFAEIDQAGEFNTHYELSNSEYKKQNVCYICKKGQFTAINKQSELVRLPIDVKLKKESCLNKFILSI